MASGRGIPCVLQEQNSFAGITNKLLKNKVAKICVAYDGMERFFPLEKIVKTGNPVRGDLVETNSDQSLAIDFFKLKNDNPIILVLGGSLGARRVNQLIEQQLPFFKALGAQLIWQCGKLYFEEYKKYESEDVKVFDFLNNMNYAYSAADIIISRAGAGSVSELCIVGKPVVFIPSPNVAEDHQTKNAEALLVEDAALMLKEKDLEDQFEKVFKELYESKEKQSQLGENIKRMAMPHATSQIVDEIDKLILKK